MMFVMYQMRDNKKPINSEVIRVVRLYILKYKRVPKYVLLNPAYKEQDFDYGVQFSDTVLKNLIWVPCDEGE